MLLELQPKEIIGLKGTTGHCDVQVKIIYVLGLNCWTDYKEYWQKDVDSCPASPRNGMLCFSREMGVLVVVPPL